MWEISSLFSCSLNTGDKYVKKSSLFSYSLYTRRGSYCSSLLSHNVCMKQCPGQIYVKNFDFIVMLWESCTRHCSYYNFDRETGAKEMSKELSAHDSEILVYSCVMCDVWCVMCDVWSSCICTLYNWITLTNLSSLSCLLTSCGFLSRVNFIMGRIGKVSVWTQYQHRGMRQFWSIRSGYCEAILSFWRWSHEDEKPYY